MQRLRELRVVLDDDVGDPLFDQTLRDRAPRHAAADDRDLLP